MLSPSEKADLALKNLDQIHIRVAAIMEQLRWRPMSSAPRDGTPIKAWHVRWHCEVTIFYSPKLSTKEDLPWIDGTRVVCWPEESFTLWRPVSFTPEEDHEPVPASQARQCLPEDGDLRGTGIGQELHVEPGGDRAGATSEADENAAAAGDVS